MRPVWPITTQLPQVPPFAKLPSWALEQASHDLADIDGLCSLDKVLSALKDSEGAQPGLGVWLRKRIARLGHHAALGAVIAMAMQIWLAFNIVAQNRLGEIREQDCESIEKLFASDERMRQQKGSLSQESEDIVAQYQPEAVRLIQEYFAEIRSAYDDIEWEDLEEVYHTLLIYVLLLSYAVKPEVGKGGYGLN